MAAGRPARIWAALAAGPVAASAWTPPPTGNGIKWLLGAVAVLLVIAIAVGITVIVMSRGGDSGSSASPTGALGDVASANDTGPASVITDEPTCDSYIAINNSIANLEAPGWGDQRDRLGEASDWSADQRRQVEAVANGMRNAADQIAPLATRTPHRLVREMYEQFIAYGRAYADSVADYKPEDNSLASANVNIGTALFAMCNAITYGSASRALGVKAVAPPNRQAGTGDLANPSRFVTSADHSTCDAWVQRENRFVAETTDWSKLDAAIAASDWTAEQRALQHAVIPTLSAQGDDMATTGRGSRNPILEDFAVAASVYLKAYLTAGDTYVKADGWLSNVAFRLNNAIGSACEADSG